MRDPEVQAQTTLGVGAGPEPVSPTTLRLTAEPVVAASRCKHNHLYALKADYLVNSGDPGGTIELNVPLESPLDLREIGFLAFGKCMVFRSVPHDEKSRSHPNESRSHLRLLGRPLSEWPTIRRHPARGRSGRGPKNRAVCFSEGVKLTV